MKGAMREYLTDLQGVRPLEFHEWTRLLIDLGLRDVESRTYRYKSFSWSTIRSIGGQRLGQGGHTISDRPKLRGWINQQEALFGDYPGYWGYGLYVGRKPQEG
ncbi:MAG: hypothetical protein ACE5OY_07825 [Candidatus Bathyarchaeia archaeon]